MGRPKKEMTNDQKFTILKHAVGVIKSHCIESKSCKDCLLLGKYPPHQLTVPGSKLVAQCPFEYGEKPFDWKITKQGHEIFLDMLPEDFEPQKATLPTPSAKPGVPNEPGNYECVDGKWIRI
jgi:hypothetical protein